MIAYHSCATDDELQQILSLQRQNLPSSVSERDRISDGFVTVHHTFDLVKKMNEICPHIIAKDDKWVIGYALCMHPDFGESIEVLKPMFAEIEATLKDSSQPLGITSKDYIVMGQVCIAKDHRGQGIFRKLYEQMKAAVIPPFSCIITEVDCKNTRSLNAHYAIGFQQLTAYHAGGQDWELIYLR